MRKHNEGYALALVLVVMVVLCLISVTVLSFSLRNLQTQQVFVERMQDKYAAEGAIEAVMSQLENLGVSCEGDASSAIHAEVKTKITGICGIEYNGVNVEPIFDNWPTEEPETTCTYTITLKSLKGTAQVICQLKLTGEISIEDKETSLEKDIYSFKSTEVVFGTYEISTVTPTEGGASQ